VRFSSCASVLDLHMLVGPNVARVLCGVVGFCYSLLLTLGTADGGTVVKVLCYKWEGRWFDSR
jgi:hypothetical protein